MIGNILGKTRDNDFDVSSNNPRNPKIVGSRENISFIICVRARQINR